MAASLTLSAATIAADGKTLTATIGGGSGTGLAISAKTGIVPHLSTGNQYGFGVTSASVSGTTLTVNMTTPAGSGETFTLDFPSSVTLTDDAGNTPTGQTNLAVTNNSTVTVNIVLWGVTPGVFELYALGAPMTSGGHTGIRAIGNGLSAGVDEFVVEFSANCTEMAAYTYSGATTTVRIDGATSDTTVPSNGFWCAKPLTASSLAAGNHLFLLNAGDQFFGVRVSGGTRAMTSVATAKQSILPNTNAQPGISGSTNITPWGVRKVGTAGRGDINIGLSYEGFRTEFGFVGTGCEIATVRATNSAWAASVDSQPAGPLLSAGTAAVNGQNGFLPLAWGNAAGSHTIQATFVGSGVNTSCYLVRVTQATKVTSAAAIGDGTLQVDSVANIASSDWLRIDMYGQREWRQVTAISGTGPYSLTLNATLGKTHAVGMPVTSYSAPAGSFYTWVYQDESAKRVVAMGDSNTEGANDYSSGLPDPSGTYYNGYDPRMPPVFLAASKSLHMEVINLGIQGQNTAQMAARASDINTLSPGGGYDYVVIWPGTNDINTGGTSSPAQFQTDVSTIVAACTGLRAGGKIILCPPGTPTGLTNSNGLNLATAATALQNVAAANPSTCVYASTLLDGVNAAEISGVHYHISGQQKIANNLLTYLGGSAVGLLSSGFFAAA